MLTEESISWKKRVIDGDGEELHVAAVDDQDASETEFLEHGLEQNIS